MTFNLTAGTEEVRHVAWIGPMAVLTALLFSIVALRVWDRLIGETTCNWRVAYSPDNRAFAIWTLLYPSAVVAVLLQWLALALPSDLAVLDWWTNLGWAGAWLCGGLWIIAFDKEEGCNFWLSALFLLSGAGCGVAALASEGAWRLHRSDVRAAAIVTTVPLALLAGWMLVASALNVGIALRATGVCGGPPDVRCAERLRARRSTSLTDEQLARRVWSSLRRQWDAREGADYSSWELLPLVLLALVVAALAYVAFEPLLPLPLLLATLLQRGFRCPSRVAEFAALSIGVAGVTLAAVRIAVWDAADVVAR